MKHTDSKTAILNIIETPTPSICISAILFFLFFSTSICLVAQTECILPSGGSLSPYKDGKNPIFSVATASCDNTNTNTNTAYTNKYKKIETYIPDSNTPIKHIKIAIHIFTGTGTLQNTSGTISDAEDVIDWLNAFYQYLDPASYPISGVTAPTDTKIRFDLDNHIFFYAGSGLHTSTNLSALISHVASVDASRLDYMGIYITAGGSAAPYAYAPYPIFFNSISYGTAGSLTGNEGIYISSTSLAYQTAQTLSHEFGHVLDLMHSYNRTSSPPCCSETCDDSESEYMYDLFGANPPSYCWENGSWGCTVTPNQNSCTNNLMGGDNLLNYYCSPMQVGKMHRSLSIKTTKRYMKEGWSFSSSIMHTTGNESWDFDIRLYQPIQVDSGETLTIDCNADVGNLTVESGATLSVTNGATLICR